MQTSVFIQVIRGLDLMLCGLVSGVATIIIIRCFLAWKNITDRQIKFLIIDIWLAFSFLTMALNQAFARGFNILNNAPLDWKDITTFFIQANLLFWLVFTLKREKSKK